jgi:uncharacterized membrane protein
MVQLAVPASVEASVLALGVLALAATMVVVLLVTIEAELTPQTVVAFTPWIVTGASAHALFSVGAYPDQFGLLFGPRAVYLTTFVAAGMAWSMMHTAASFTGSTGSDAQYLTATGLGALVVSVWAALTQGLGADTGLVLALVGALVGAVAVALSAFVGLSVVYSKAAIHTGAVGYLAVFGQALDAATTVVAVDVLSIPASYPTGRAVVEAAATLPTAAVLGTGWVLLVLRVGLALVVVAALAAVVSRRSDSDGVAYLLLGALVAYGLGPGIHHLVVLAITG